MCSAPDIPAPPAPTAPPQAAVAATTNIYQNRNQANQPNGNMPGGTSATLLTGALGAPVSNSNLGRSTLLGGLA